MPINWSSVGLLSVAKDVTKTSPVLFFLVSKNIGVPFSEIMMVFAVVYMEWINSKCWWLSWIIFHLSTGFSEAFLDGNIFLNKVFFHGNFLSFHFLHDVLSLLMLLDFLSLEEVPFTNDRYGPKMRAERLLMFCLTFLDISKLLGV